LAVASATVLGLWGPQAAALSLGTITVKSALGEPLRAEIDILDINAEEAASLKTRIALPDAFQAAGLEYSASLNGLQIELEKRSDGRPFLSLSNSRAVNDPYLDLILEASWSTGRIVRDYTILLDPPKLAPAQKAPPTPPQVSSVPLVIEPAPAPVAVVAEPAAPMAPPPEVPVVQTPAPTVSESAPAPAPTPVPVEPEAASEAPPPPTPASEPVASTPPPEPVAIAAQAIPSVKRVKVKAGDTASQIAVAEKQWNVSLDQMLVAMLRANPDAFVRGNVNRMRAGAVMAMPSAEDAQAIPTDEARQILVAQSRDFNAFRRQLASAAPVSTEAAADRKTSGTVQTQVEEKKPAVATPDKLTLSKGTVQGPSAEDKLAKEREAKAAATRSAELTKNIAELDKLSKAAAKAETPAPAPTPAPKTETAAPPAPVVPAPPVVSAPAPKPPAPAPVPTPPKRVTPPVPATAPVAEEPGFLDELLDNPMIPAAAGGLVALLAGLAFYRSRQRKSGAQVDSSYLESRLQPDSFFGASGGQQVDTNDNNSSNSSSMVYSPSQLDAGDDVDPVAEADVYLAYGRDLQAEEILKEALRHHPSRVAIHQKLLEIYAKRRDVKNFGIIAKEAYKVTGGNGPEWEQICELGRGIDPSNAVYSAGGVPPASASAPLQDMPDTRQAVSAAAVSAPVAVAAATSPDLDLDLDFSLDDAPSSVPAAPTAATMPAPIATAPVDNSMEFDAPSLPQLSPEPAAALSTPADEGLMNFDMGALSLDLGTPSEQPTSTEDDPLATKLALADEFKAIGDTDGARALIEEIIAEASGDVKARAQKALSQLA
jgi:pilus assembly protein FimV